MCWHCELYHQYNNFTTNSMASGTTDITHYIANILIWQQVKKQWAIHAQMVSDHMFQAYAWEFHKNAHPNCSCKSDRSSNSVSHLNFCLIADHGQKWSPSEWQEWSPSVDILWIHLPCEKQGFANGFVFILKLKMNNSIMHSTSPRRALAAPSLRHRLQPPPRGPWPSLVMSGRPWPAAGRPALALPGYDRPWLPGPGFRALAGRWLAVARRVVGRGCRPKGLRHTGQGLL